MSCCAWSKRALKLWSVGKFLTGGFWPSRLVWQMAHIGMFGVTNCGRWQPVQALWPGRRGEAELSRRSWHEAQASEAWRWLVCRNLEKSTFDCRAAARKFTPGGAALARETAARPPK